MDPENKKKGFIPQDEEYYQNEEQPVRRDIEPLERLEPITDPDAGPTQPAEKGLAPVATETPVELNAEQQLARDYAQQIQAENAVANNQINSVADLVSAAEKERSSRLANDETARRRENAYRYIAGVGDAISGVANLVGTAHGAAHQQQTYNAPGLMSKIESSRAQRTKKMEDLNKKIDELRQRETELKSAKSLREAQLKATHAKEQRALRIQQEAAERENYWKQKRHEMDAAKSVASIAENEAERKWESEQNAADRASREAINAADNASREAIERQRAEAKDAQDKEKLARDPQYKASVLRQNVTGIRDELARKMGYQDYNEYLKGKNWKKNTLKKNQPNDIYEQRVKEFPEIEELLNGLANPEMLSEESIDMYIGASDVFADAVNAKSAPVQVDESGREIVEY